uniref:DDE Tnp4 domain-containing protein n=1 Tax=Gasterosteus aculeatus aculeatus TaxID=481459 RepID=A0AAQ4QKW3_GASAC
MHSGTYCAVQGCNNSWRLLNVWSEGECFDHQPSTKRQCGCAPPYALYEKPKTDVESRKWLAPTEENPFLEFWLGYERPPQQKRRKLNRNRSDTRVYTFIVDAVCLLEVCIEPKFKDAAIQWEDLTKTDHSYAAKLDHVNKSTQTGGQTVADDMLLDDDTSLLYTGLRLLYFFTLVKTMLPFSKPSCSIPVVDQILMTLMKLKLNLVLGDVAKHFKVSKGEVSKVIAHWIDTLGEQLEPMVAWLPRSVIRANMPPSFKKNHPQTTCIIDCAETAIQRPTNLNCRSATFSHYKGTNTAKYLVAVSPHGLIMFISEAYALEALRPGDEVMADRGFTIRDVLHEKKVKLNIPAFTYKRGQLTNEQVTRTRRVANVCIHVERAIRRLSLQNSVPNCPHLHDPEVGQDSYHMCCFSKHEVQTHPTVT